MDGDQPIPAVPSHEMGAPIPAGTEMAAPTPVAPIDGIPVDTALVPVRIAQQLPTTPPPATEPGTLPLIAGYLNIGVGLVVLAMFGMYIAGFGIWITHLKVTGRDEGIAWMERAVQTAFWLAVLLGAVRFVQHNTQAAIAILSVVVLIVVAWMAFKVIQASGAEDDEH